MNYIKEAENVLWYYRDIYRSIENINRQIAKLIGQHGPSELSAIALDITGVRGSGQDETVNLVYQIQTLTDQREASKKELEDIDLILHDICQDKGCELYAALLKEWYVFKTPKEDIAKSIGYSSKQSVYDLKNKAIRKFAANYHGISAVKAM